MKKISLVLCFALMLVLVFAFNVFAATKNDITADARFEQNGSSSDLLDLSKVIDGDYNTASSCGNAGENWVNYRFYYDEGTTVSKVFVVLNSTGTLSNGTVYETVSECSYEFYVRLYDKYENAIFNTKYHSVNDATEITDADGNVLYTCFEIEFETPYSDIYMVEVPVVNNKNADVGLWEVEIYNYVCGDDEHTWVGELCGEHCDVCGQVKDPTLVCEAEEDDGDCRTAVLCKYCDSVIVASQKHTFANGETVCSNDGCVFEGKNIAKDTSITPVDVSENSYGENGEFLNWWYYSAHITDGKYDTIAHSNYWGQYKFTFTIKNPTTLSEIFIVSNSSGVYHPWGYGHDNLTTDLAVKVIIYDADDNVIQTVEYQSLDFTNPNVVPIYAEDGNMTSVGYKLDTNYATAKKVELYINQGVWEVEIYEHVTCDYQFIETVAPGCTTEGYDLYKCACGNEKYENTVAALGHSYDDGVVTKEAGEEEDGEILYTCAVCGGTKTLAIPATGHEHSYDTYVENSVEPTCATVGSATYQCRCGDTTEVEIPATGNHNYTEFAGYTVEPTYLNDGYADYKCATCDATINVNVGRLQMNTAKYAEVVKELGGWTADGVNYLIDGNYNIGCGGSHSTNGWAFSLTYGEDYYFNKLAFVVNSVGSMPTPDFNFTEKTTKNYSFAITLYDADGNAVWTKSTTCAEAVEMTGVDANGNEFLYDVVTIELDEAVVASKLYVKINSGWDNGAGMWEVETYGLPVNYHEVHDYTVLLETYTEPTCGVAGSGLYRCAKCETTSVEDIPATEQHTFNIEATVDPTCTEAGSITRVCAVCEKAVVETIEANGHKYTYPCDKICNVCNELTNEAAEHTIVHVDAVAATCFEDGNVEYWYCSDCGSAWLDEALTQQTNLKSVVTPMAHGTITHVEAKAATCFEDGNIEYWYCEACGYAWLDADCTLNTNLKAVVLPKAHGTITHVEAKAATCFEDGNIEYWYCEACGYAWLDEACTLNTNLKAVVLPKAHGTITHVEAVEATCTATGNIEYWYCEACGYAWLDEACTLNTNLKAVVLPATGHQYSYGFDYEYIWPTCKEEGLVKDVCAVCNVAFTEVVPVDPENGHKWVMDTYVPATCLEDGYSDQTCSICGATRKLVLSKDFAQHDYVLDEESYVKPTCQVAGYSKSVCSLCGDVQEETFEPNSYLHDMVYSNGGLLGTCNICGATVFHFVEMGGVDNDYAAAFAWEGTAINIYDPDYITNLFYYFNITSSENGVYNLEITNCDEDTLGLVGGTAVLTLEENGGTLVITAGETTYTFTNLESEEPDVPEDYNYLINGTFASSDGAIKIEFKDGVATVITNEAGLELGESFTYTYNPMLGIIDTAVPYYMTYNVNDDAVYIGQGALYRVTEEDPDEPEEPNYGDKIGSITVSTTDTYSWIDEYHYTADKAGQYTFFVPGGYGLWSFAAYDSRLDPEADFQSLMNPNTNGVYVVVNLEANEVYSFYVSAPEKTTWTIDVYYYLAETHECKFVETSRVESTCTKPGYVVYECECGETKTEALELADHTEEIIPAIPGELREPGMTSGIECSVCGEVIKAPVQASGDFRIASVSLSLAENIGIVYKVQVPEGYENVYMVFQMTVVENGVEVVKEFPVTGYEIDPANGRYAFTFSGVRLQWMADLVTATVYAEKDGVVSANSYSNYSVKTYILSQLGKSTSSATLKTMLSDLLILGAKTQIYADYKADNLMTADVDASLLTPSTYAGVPSDEFVQKMIVNDENTRNIADWKTVSLTFKDAMSYQFKLAIDPSALQDIKIVVTIPVPGKEARVDEYTAEDLEYIESENRYLLSVDNVKALQYGETVVGDIYYQGEKISRTVNYSVNSYIQKNQDSTDAGLRDFLRAVYLYGEAVRIYSGN